jgi:hypothetical protein
MSGQAGNSKKHSGGCNCGDVRYEVVVDAGAATSCNCSICTRLGLLGAIVKPEAFTLLSDQSKLASYSRAPDIANRYFCAHCHVCCFGKGSLPQLGGAFVSVNMNTLDDFDPAEARLSHWDGRHDNWAAGTRPKPWPVRA